MIKSWLEAKSQQSIHPEMDKWLAAVDKLSKVIKKLEAAKEKFKIKTIRPEKKPEVKKPEKELEREPEKELDKETEKLDSKEKPGKSKKETIKKPKETVKKPKESDKKNVEQQKVPRQKVSKSKKPIE